MEIEEQRKRQGLRISEIGGYWLQKKLTELKVDPQEILQMEKRILNALISELDSECENFLYEIFLGDHQDFLILLLKNRHKIWYCTKAG